MENIPARTLWLQNNNSNAPGPRQQNSMRPNQGQNQGPNGQPPQRNSSSLNRWLLIIVILMLGVYLFQFFNNASSNNTPQRAELTYSQFYQQIDKGNIKSATIIGSTDITGKLCTAIGDKTDYHVVQMPNGDNGLI